MPLTAGKYAPAGKVTGRLGGPPDSATVHARIWPCMPCWTWKSHTRPGAAAGAKNGCGPEHARTPGQVIGDGSDHPVTHVHQPAAHLRQQRLEVARADGWFLALREPAGTQVIDCHGPQHRPKLAGHITSVVPMLPGIGAGAAACRAATCDLG